MATLRYAKAARLDKLADELVAAGVTPQWCEGEGGEVRVTVADAASRPAVDAVVAAHNPAAYDTQDTQAATRRQQDIDLAKQYLALAPGTATLAQTQAYGQALGRLVRALAQIV